MDLDINKLKQFSIVLSAQELNPLMLTLDFLKGSGVILENWEPARPQVISRQGSRVVFKNGVAISAQPGAVQFSKSSTDGDLDDSVLVDLAQRYVTALPNLNYRGVGIGPRRFVVFESADVAHRFIHERLLNQGSWQEFGSAPMQASLNLIYTLERCQLQLTVNEGRLRVSENQAIPGAVFGGNFQYLIQSESAEERLELLQQSVSHWREDLTMFQELVDQQFLAGGNELLADVAV